MPVNKRPENPLDVLKRLEKRVRILEQARRLPSLIGVHIAKGSNQTIATGMAVTELVTFTTPTEFDTDGFFDNVNDRLVVPDDLDAYYWIYAKTEWANGTGPLRNRLRYNGVGFTDTYSSSVGGTSTSSVFTGITKYLFAGDYVNLVASQDQGSDRQVIGTGDDFGTYLGMIFLGR